MQQFSIKVTKKMNINKNVQGHLFALTANVMWGLMAPIGKFALQEFSALSVTTFRMWGQLPLSGYSPCSASRNM